LGFIWTKNKKKKLEKTRLGQSQLICNGVEKRGTGTCKRPVNRPVEKEEEVETDSTKKEEEEREFGRYDLEYRPPSMG